MGYDMSDETLRVFLSERGTASVATVDAAGVLRVQIVSFTHREHHVSFSARPGSPLAAAVSEKREMAFLAYDEESPASYVLAVGKGEHVGTTPSPPDVEHRTSLEIELSVAQRITSDASQVEDQAGDAARRPLGKAHWPEG